MSFNTQQRREFFLKIEGFLGKATYVKNETFLGNQEKPFQHMNQ
jgi:hypothetical protein